MLAKDYRPDDFDEYWGNETQIKSLQRKLGDEDNAPNCFLITGMSGVGKTTLARIIGSSLEMAAEETNEIDAVNYGGIETVRQLRKEIRLPPVFGDKRLYIMDECHEMPPKAQEGMLKTLEECPSHTFFVLCTTNPEKLKKRLKRRCLHIELEPLDKREMLEFIEYIDEEEDIDIPDGVAKQIAQDSMGSPGLCLAILEKLVGLEPEEMEEVSTKIVEQQNETIKLIRHLMDTKKKKWQTVGSILKGMDKSNPESTRRAIIGYVSNMLMSKESTRAFIVLDSFVDNVYDSGWAGIVHGCYTIYMENK